jgi:hypothetical protein
VTYLLNTLPWEWAHFLSVSHLETCVDLIRFISNLDLEGRNINGLSNTSKAFRKKLPIKGQCYEFNFQQFSPIVGEKMDIFLKTNVLIINACTNCWMYFVACFRQKYLQNIYIGPYMHSLNNTSPTYQVTVYSNMLQIQYIEL